jgi:nucleoside-diphosphate-sugar epimerase
LNVLLFGATGYVGSAVADRLLAAGHELVAAVHGERGEELAGMATLRADLADPASVHAVITPETDAVVHAAAPSGDWDAELAAVETMLAALAGTGRALIYTSGVWVLGAIGPSGADESSPANPAEISAGRPAIERQVLAAAEQGARGAVVRPGIVHGRGGGIPALMVEWARQAGAGRYVGDSGTRWPMVHVDDLADLFVLAVEQAPAGCLVHGVAEPAVPVTALAEAADMAAGGPGRYVAWPVAEAAGALGAPFAQALALDQTVRTTRAAGLGWRPGRIGAVEDLRSGSYVTSSV